MALSIKTPAQWASAFLGALGLPNTPTNVQNIVAWETEEGGNWHNPDKYNPLNTTEDAPGAVSTNSVGVKAYTSWQEGLDATVATIQQPGYGYPEILAALNTSQPYAKFASAVDASSWGSHLSGASADNSASPSTAAATAGATATDTAGTTGQASGNVPSTTPGSGKLQGFAGVLQAMDAMYNPELSGPNWNPISWFTFVPKDIEGVAIEIFTRAASSILAVGIIGIGIVTLLHSERSGGAGSAGGNTIEFINNAAASNRRESLSRERLGAQQTKEQDVAARHAQRLAHQAAENEANRQTRIKVANTPRTVIRKNESVIKHESSKPKVKVKWMPNPTEKPKTRRSSNAKK